MQRIQGVGAGGAGRWRGQSPWAPGPTWSWAGGLSSLGGSFVDSLGFRAEVGHRRPGSFPQGLPARQLTRRDVCFPGHPGPCAGGRGWHPRLGPGVEAWLWWQERQEQVVGAVTGGQTLPDVGTRDAPSYYLMEAARSGGVESPRFCFCSCQLTFLSFSSLSPPCDEAPSAGRACLVLGSSEGAVRVPCDEGPAGQMDRLCVLTGSWRLFCASQGSTCPNAVSFRRPEQGVMVAPNVGRFAKLSLSQRLPEDLVRTRQSRVLMG